MRRVLLTWVCLLSVIAGLAACGGGSSGGGSGDINLPPPPDSSASEGNTENPVMLALNTPHTGKAGAGNFSVYAFTTEQSGTYTITITNSNVTTSSFFGTLHTSPYTQNPLWNSYYGWSVTDLSAGTSYILVLYNYSRVNATYTITVSPAQPPAPTIPASPTISASGAVLQNIIAWSSVSHATSYNLYWSLINNFNLTDNGVTKITGVTSPYVHRGLTPNTTYYYRVTAVNAAGESNPSNIAPATPFDANVVNLPFITNFDDGSLNGWVATGDWGIEDWMYNSPPNSVTDSPKKDHYRKINSWIVSPPLNLADSTAPKLSFYHATLFPDWEGKIAFVEISPDNGVTWTKLASYARTSDVILSMKREQIDLTAYKNNIVLIRFRLDTTNSLEGSTGTNGWYIDDIQVTPN